MEHYLKLCLMFSLCVIASQLCAMSPDVMHNLLRQKEIREAICNNLSEIDLNRMAQLTDK